MENNKQPKILFEYENIDIIDSVYVFNNGDFLIFIIDKNGSPLYDGKTFKEKSKINVSSEHCFFYLSEYEYGLFINYEFKLYNFNKERTESEFLQTIIPKPFSSGKKLSKLSNGDLLVYIFYLGRLIIDIYRRKSPSVPYELINTINSLNYDEIIELNEKEIMGYKRNYAPDSISFKVMNINNYQVLRENNIIFDMKEPTSSTKKRIYLSLPIYKISDKKLISFGINNIYIFETDHLELETTIQLTNYIQTVLIRPKGNIFLFGSKSSLLGDYYFNKIKIDYQTNDLISDEELQDIKNIQIQHPNIFKMYNYLNNGLVMVNSKQKVIIYEDYFD